MISQNLANLAYVLVLIQVETAFFPAGVPTSTRGYLGRIVLGTGSGKHFDSLILCSV